MVVRLEGDVRKTKRKCDERLKKNATMGALGTVLVVLMGIVRDLVNGMVVCEGVEWLRVEVWNHWMVVGVWNLALVRTCNRTRNS
jgi:hypothetical protein